MTTALQIAVDCVDPHRLAEFWAGALGYEVEDHGDLVRRMLEAGYATEAETVTVDGRLSWREAAVCIDPTGGRPRMLFQVVPEQKTVKNRVHLDLHVGPERREEEVDRHVGLGARRIGEGTQGPLRWVVMADPEGNEYCVA